MRSFRTLAVLLVAIPVTFAGCGGGPVEEKIAVPTSAIVANVKKALEGMEKSGQTGSGLSSLESDINGMKSIDPAKSEELMKGFRELQVLSDAAKIKAKAKELLGKL